jgi:hypothetical protein
MTFCCSTIFTVDIGFLKREHEHIVNVILSRFRTVHHVYRERSPPCNVPNRKFKKCPCNVHAYDPERLTTRKVRAGNALK